MILAAEKTKKRTTDYFLQELVHRFFDKDRHSAGVQDQPIQTAANFISLWERPLWEFILGLNGSLTNVSIDNPGDYGETQLTSRSPNTGFKTEGEVSVIRSNRNHRFADYLKAQYGMLQIGEGSFNETQDLITEELQYSWTRWRNREGRGRFWIPAPLVKGKLETEFTAAPKVYRKDDDGNYLFGDVGQKMLEYQPYHHLEVTGTAGFEWLLGEKVSLGLGYGLRTEALASQGSGRRGLQTGLEVYYQIIKLPLYMWTPSRGLTLNSKFDLFYSDWTDKHTLKSSGSTKLVASVLGPLSFTVGLDFFLFQTGDSKLAYAVDTMFGLSFSYDAAFQVF